MYALLAIAQSLLLTVLKIGRALERCASVSYRKVVWQCISPYVSMSRQ